MADIGANLKKVIETAKFYNNPENTSQKLTEIEINILECEKEIKSLLPIEEGAKQTLQEKLLELKRIRCNLKYPKLSLEPLSLRNDKGFPIFALFNINEREFRISENHSSLRLPDPIKNIYKDVSDKLDSTHYPNTPVWMRTIPVFTAPISIVIIGLIGSLAHLVLEGSKTEYCPIPWYGHIAAIILGIACLTYLIKDDYNLTITAKYTGVIPNKTRLKILEAQKDKYFESIYILAEIPEWKIEEISTPATDPLILGYANNSLYIIDIFDTTPIEYYINKEFTS